MIGDIGQGLTHVAVGQRFNNRENALPYSWTQQCDPGTLGFGKLSSAVPRLWHAGSQLEGGVSGQ